MQSPNFFDPVMLVLHDLPASLRVTVLVLVGERVNDSFSLANLVTELWSVSSQQHPTPRNALSVGPLVRSSRFLPHLTQTHTPEHVR